MGNSIIKGIVWIVFLSLVGVIIFSGYTTFIQTSYNHSYTTYSFTVSKGMTMRTIAQELEEKKIVNSESSIIFYNQFNPVDNLQIGEYTLQLPASPQEIVAQISSQSFTIEQSRTSPVPTTRVLIKEGQNIDTIADILASNNLVEKSVFLKLAQTPYTPFQQEYSFLPAPLSCTYGTQADCAKYYLEGFLYPDTYDFKQGSTPEEIIKVFLDNFEKKVIQTQITASSPLNLKDTITLASLIEKETGRPIEGVTADNKDTLENERRLVAGVFLNRIAKGMKLGSDPTIGYWANRTVCQQTLSIPNCIGINDPLTEHSLNTYSIVGLPQGAITNPQASVIKAASQPEPSNYLYFVSDKYGKKYFSEDYQGHVENIAKVKQINNNS